MNAPDPERRFNAPVAVVLMAMFAMVTVGFAVLIGTVGDPGRKPEPGPTVTELMYVTATPVPAPTVTITKTPKPRPTKTIYVNRSYQRLSLSDEAFLRCVVKRESGGNPKAQNPYSSASGLFQFIDGTWRAYSRESGIGDSYSRAKYAPAEVQWALARWVVDNKGRYPWKPTVPGTGC